MDLFLILLVLAYLVVASAQDLRKREVWNWLSFSLIISVLAYRAFYSVINNDILFLAYSIGGLLLFVGLGYLFYYARVFAGGDAKLLFGMGACLVISGSFFENLISLGLFVLLLLFLGGLWGLFYSAFLAFRNRKAFSLELGKQLKEMKLFFCLAFICSVILLGFVIYLGEFIFFVIPLIVILLPLIYVYGKAVENSCMIQYVKVSELTEGDWLVSSVRVGKKVIKPNWEGISEKELAILRKYRGRVKIKVGIPFVPGFLFAFLVWIYLRISGWIVF